MPTHTTSRKKGMGKAKGLSAVKNPTGRLDWLAASLIDRVVKLSPDPMVHMAHQELAPVVEGVLRRYLGPCNETARKIQRFIRQGKQAMDERQSRMGMTPGVRPTI